MVKTETSSNSRTRLTRTLVLLCNEVISPSRGPGPRLQVRYSDEPSPTINTPAIVTGMPTANVSTLGKNLIETSKTAAITTIFEIVPRPGFSFSGIHRSKTTTLTKKVVTPISSPVRLVKPSDKTTQGELPRPVITRSASPNPKSDNPRIRIKNVEKLGCHRLSLRQDVRGIVRWPRKMISRQDSWSDTNQLGNCANLNPTICCLLFLCLVLIFLVLRTKRICNNLEINIRRRQL